MGRKPSAQRKGIITRRLTEELEAGLALVRALDAVGERARLEDDLTPEQWSALASGVARRRAGTTERAILDHLGLDATAEQLGGYGDRNVLESIPWATEELLAKLEEEADRGDDQ